MGFYSSVGTYLNLLRESDKNIMLACLNAKEEEFGLNRRERQDGG
jgi:hypothetical protein